MQQPRSPRPGTVADRAFVRTAAVGIGTTGAWSAVWVGLGLWTLAPLGLLATVAQLGAVWVRLRAGYATATRLGVGADYVMMVGVVLLTGGMDGPLAVLFLILPAGPALALGIGECARWGVLVFATGTAIWLWERHAGSLPDATPAGWANLFEAAAQGSVLVCTLLVLVTYAWMHETARARLRRSREELEQAHARLVESQQQLVVSEKMAALGRVTAGMAHEINSSLAGASSALELAQIGADDLREAILDPALSGAERLALLDDLVDSTELGRTALRRIAEFVRRMQGQTRPTESARRRFSPATEAQTVLRLFEGPFMAQGVRVHAALDPLAGLFGDPGRFGQIVQNLVANAVDACRGRDAEVRVRLFREGESVVLEVEDGGQGIPEEIRTRVFDYLFTTKGIGEGTGLGLALVHDVVTEHFGGTITFTSEVGQGTCFRVALPHGSGTGA